MSEMAHPVSSNLVCSLAVSPHSRQLHQVYCHNFKAVSCTWALIVPSLQVGREHKSAWQLKSSSSSSWTRLRSRREPLLGLKQTFLPDCHKIHFVQVNQSHKHSKPAKCDKTWNQEVYFEVKSCLHLTFSFNTRTTEVLKLYIWRLFVQLQVIWNFW